MAPRVFSIILCTCNRPAGLAATVKTLAKLTIPAGWMAELIVVDNAPNEATADVVRKASAPGLELIYLPEPRKGKSNALNTGINRSHGELLLFTDDDVLVSPDWAEQMLAALQQDGCDAVVGRIDLAPELERPWLTPLQRWWLAVPSGQPDDAAELIGANMGLRRSVLEVVPEFDSELGPGALGLGEEALFSAQLVTAGRRIVYAAKARVVHNPGAGRLQRQSWLNHARQIGRQEAYYLHHWTHETLPWAWLKQWWLAAKLVLRRCLQPRPPLESEGCSDWEVSYVQDLEMCRRFCQERKRARNYARHGLRKLRH